MKRLIKTQSDRILIDPAILAAIGHRFLAQKKKIYLYLFVYLFLTSGLSMILIDFRQKIVSAVLSKPVFDNTSASWMDHDELI